MIDLDAAHLEPEAMAAAHRHLVVKALSELSHERLLTPRPEGDGSWSVTTRSGRLRHTFRARVLPLEHWDIDAPSVCATLEGAGIELDVLRLVNDLQPELGVTDALLGVYLEELSSTLAGHAWKIHHRRADARDVARADLQTVERSMTEGHPAFLANNGRIGFSLTDHAGYAPEAGRPVRLRWLAARRSATNLACGQGVDEASLYAAELGEDLLAHFGSRLRELGCDPADYLYLPVHPWQWAHRITITFAADVARRDLVLVGDSADAYQPQQSIRTMFNLDHPERHYVKTALAIQNMGFLRGLSPAYMRVTPAINDWVADVVAGDPELAAHGFGVLRELASIGYTGDIYHRAADRRTRSPYQRMVAALWRESPVPQLDPGQRAMTMAALMHRDHDGRSLLATLVADSGLGAGEWFGRYLRAYLTPVVHCLLVHDLAFMPHGENVVLVLEGHAVVGALMKDIGEEVVVFGDRPLPPDVERVRVDYNDEIRLLSVFSDVFDGVLRYIVTILDSDGLLSVEDAWGEVAACLREHRAAHPEIHARFDLFTPRFRHSCLNRLQLRNTLQMVDLGDLAASLSFAGTLANPITDAGGSTCGH